ncbi:ArsR/SmtB family transcription factor [Halopiger thermotolerans]
MGSQSGSRDESLGYRTGRQESDRSPDQILSALGDGECRELLRHLTDGPSTAEELSRICDIPSSTLYRKMEKLIDGGLVTEGTEISTGGRNATLYEQRVDGVSVQIEDSEQIELETSIRANANQISGETE